MATILRVTLVPQYTHARSREITQHPNYPQCLSISASGLQTGSATWSRDLKKALSANQKPPFRSRDTYHGRGWK